MGKRLGGEENEDISPFLDFPSHPNPTRYHPLIPPLS